MGRMGRMSRTMLLIRPTRLIRLVRRSVETLIAEAAIEKYVSKRDGQHPLPEGPPSRSGILPPRIPYGVCGGVALSWELQGLHRIAGPDSAPLASRRRGRFF